MDHFLCINTNSLPAKNKDEAIALLMDAFQGVMELFVEDNDRVVFYLDSIDNGILHDLEISDGFNYIDFLDYLANNNENDLLSVLYEIEDKSPALDFFDIDELEEITEYSYYLPNVATHNNPEIFSIADHLSAKLLSLNTSPEWNNCQLTFHKTRNGEFSANTCLIDNISTKLHGKQLYHIYNSLDLKKACSTALISDSLLEWFSKLINENQNIVYKKLSYCQERKFRGNEPLFKSITGSDGLWEVRFRAFSGGAIRILYKTHNEKNILLIGFIKKSDAEGYTQNIENAENVFKENYN